MSLVRLERTAQVWSNLGGRCESGPTREDGMSLVRLGRTVRVWSDSRGQRKFAVQFERAAQLG